MKGLIQVLSRCMRGNSFYLTMSKAIVVDVDSEERLYLAEDRKCEIKTL